MAPRTVTLALLALAAAGCAISHRTRDDAPDGSVRDVLRPDVADVARDDVQRDFDVVRDDAATDAQDVVQPDNVVGEDVQPDIVVPEDVPVDVPVDVPADVPVDVPADVRPDVPADVPDACGGADQPCCTGAGATPCAAGGRCIAGTCRTACGGPGQPCCSGACGAGTQCLDAGGSVGTRCLSCGALGQPCCPGMTRCTAGSCQDHTTTLSFCTSGGAENNTRGGDCDISGIAGSCAGGDRCVGNPGFTTSGHCVQCGTPGLPCCRAMGSTSLTCSSGSCESDGFNAACAP